VALLVVLRMALERAVVGDVLAARVAVEVEAGLVPEVRFPGEVLERGDGELIARLAIRSVVQAESFAETAVR
jgi:hypothetical protein